MKGDLWLYMWKTYVRRESLKPLSVYGDIYVQNVNLRPFNWNCFLFLHPRGEISLFLTSAPRVSPRAKMPRTLYMALYKTFACNKNLHDVITALAHIYMYAACNVLRPRFIIFNWSHDTHNLARRKRSRTYASNADLFARCHEANLRIRKEAWRFFATAIKSSAIYSRKCVLMSRIFILRTGNRKEKMAMNMYMKFS